MVISRRSLDYGRERITKMIVRTMLVLSLCSFSAHRAYGTTYNSNGSSADVQAKLNLCSNGDTVTLPAGTFTWTHKVSRNVPADVTLQGAGTSTLAV